jgi:hypothetical protein
MTTNLTSQTQAMLTLINNYRAQNGAGPLVISPTLSQAAQWMSADMATNNYLSHTDSLGRDPFTRMDAFGYTSQTLRGENVAAGDADAQSTFNSWIEACDPSSSGTCTYAHRSNIINPGFQAIGIGEAYNPNSTYQYYWTTDFGGVVDTGATGTTGTTPPVAPTPSVPGPAPISAPPTLPVPAPIAPPVIPPPVIPTTSPTFVPTVPSSIPIAPSSGQINTTPTFISGNGTNQPNQTNQTNQMNQTNQLQPGLLLNGQCFCPSIVPATTQLEAVSTSSHLWIIIVIIVIIIILGVLYYQHRSSSHARLM